VRREREDLLSSESEDDDDVEDASNVIKTKHDLMLRSEACLSAYLFLYNSFFCNMHLFCIYLLIS